ncbi:MAG TPA: methylmalonyl-CoA epimerase [Anaerolineales bacterium]|nr:methylmalonyl-CoA epimerase [Anaerolineales bacterium]
MIKAINHIAIVVPDFESALPFWQDALGLQLSHTEDVPSQAVEVAFFPMGDSEVELLRPTTPDSGVAKYLAKRGAGMHHIALEVDDIYAMLARLKEKGVRLINEQPVPAAGGKLAAFIHPEAANGVLVELYQVG